MVLIPPDAGIRLRTQTDAVPLQPAAPIQEIPADLPELRTGQAFTARIQEVLPENTYKALVAGKSLTLQLPANAKAGDTLELVVIDRTPRVVIAQLANEAAAGAAEAYPYATLSRAGQMIGNLLLPEGETPKPALLNRGRPLLMEPPAAAGAETPHAPPTLAPALAKSVEQSGLFYEAHQAQWLAGRLPTETLLQEPQAQRSAPITFHQHNLPPPQLAASSATQVASESLLRGLFAREEPAAATSQANTTANQIASSIPEDLRPLVQQQLDAAATQRLVWHGEIWPRQTMEWEIARERTEGDGSQGGTEEQAGWRTSLRLTTPRLGEIAATIQLTVAGIHLTLSTPYGASAADLRDEAPALAAALDAAGIALLSFHVRHETEHESSG